MFLDTLSFSIPRKRDLINFTKNEPRYPRGTLNISLSPRFNLALAGIRSQKVTLSRNLYIPGRVLRLPRTTMFLIGAITIACT